VTDYIALESTTYLWFGSNNTSGSGDDGASAVFDVRLAGAAASAAPVLSGSATLLTHANYSAGAYEIAVAATTGNGFAVGNTYAVFCTLLVDSQNPTGFVGAFKIAGVLADVGYLQGDNTAALGLANLGNQFNDEGWVATNVKFWKDVSVATGSLPVDKVAGTAGGVFLAGSNAATTIASVSITDGLTVARSTSNTDAATFTGNGTGAGVKILSGTGTTATALVVTGQGSSSGAGATFTGSGSVVSYGVRCLGTGVGSGFNATGGTTGYGGEFVGGASGPGLLLQAGSGKLALKVTGDAQFDNDLDVLGAVTMDDSGNAISLGAAERTAIVAALAASIIKGSYSFADLEKDLAAAVGGIVTGGGLNYAVPGTGWGGADTNLAVAGTLGDRTLTRS
jgi:hypothetical protein